MTFDRRDHSDRVAATARWTAAERARESARPDRLFVDPLAGVLAGEEGRELAERMRKGGAFDNPGIAIRTRFFDDALTRAVGADTPPAQVVLLAAGMDSRAFRLDLPRELEWYELDRPDLLALKERVLREVGAAPRCARHPVGVDLTGDWAGPLAAAGFESTRPTTWLLEGLVFYLDSAAVHGLLDEITRLSAPGSELLADTIGRSVLDSEQMRPWRNWLAEQGIPWRFGTDQPEDDLFEPRGWTARASLYSEIGADLGRWPLPIFPRGTSDVPQSFLMHATR